MATRSTPPSKLVLVVLGLALAVATAPRVGIAQAASEADLAMAVDQAGRQRMLTQRITKSYLQIGLGAKTEESREQLRNAVALFDKQLADLKSFAPNANISTALNRLDSLWTPFKRTALGEIDKDTARRMAIMDTELLRSCEDIVALLQDVARKNHARLVNTAGRQRMLSQRLAKFYMSKAAGLGTPSMENELDRARNEFKGALLTLSSAPENTSAINEELERVAEQWVWLESSLVMETSVHYPLIVADASEKILTLMESVTRQYVELAAGDAGS